MTRKVLPVLFGFSFLIAALLSSVAAVVFDHGFYIRLYDKLNLAETVSVSDEDLQNSIFMMTDYVEGKRDNLDGKVFWKNEVRDTFNAKEKKHMVDVRQLWQNARLVMIVSWFVCLISAGWLFWKFGSNGTRCLGILMTGIRQAGACLLVVLIFFAFWYFIDFTGLWTWFHTLFFAGNTDWLLNPATDFMIVICPEAMFSTMIAKIAIKLILAVLGFYGGMAYLKSRLQEQRYLQRIVPQSHLHPQTDSESVGR